MTDSRWHRTICSCGSSRRHCSCSCRCGCSCSWCTCSCSCGCSCNCTSLQSSRDLRHCPFAAAALAAAAARLRHGRGRNRGRGVAWRSWVSTLELYLFLSLPRSCTCFSRCLGFCRAADQPLLRCSVRGRGTAAGGGFHLVLSGQAPVSAAATIAVTPWSGGGGGFHPLRCGRPPVAAAAAMGTVAVAMWKRGGGIPPVAVLSAAVVWMGTAAGAPRRW